MKKISAFVLTGIISLSAVVPYSVSAEGENTDENLPVMYLTVSDSEKISIFPNGSVYINTSELTEDISMRVNVYVKDEQQNLWDVAPKVKSESSYISFTEDAVDPSDVGESGAYQSGYDFIQSVDQECNTVNIKISTPMFAPSDTVLTPTGNATDDFPVAYFNASVDSDIPSGKYRIYFLTEPEDYPDQRTTTVSSIVYSSTTPQVKEQKIFVSDRKLGDVNNDGFIDSVDASSILAEYARLATYQENTDDMFDISQSVSGDVNADGFVDSVDASNVLSYYAYASTSGTEETSSFLEYLYSLQ